MAIVKGPRCSARRHSTTIGLSDHSLPRILHKDLNFHPYKTAIVEELNDRGTINRRISSEQLLEMLNGDGVNSTLLMTDEAYFHLSGYVNKIIATGHLKIHNSSISVLSTAKDCVSVVGSHLLEFLALTSLKTTKVQPLLWHLSAMWQCYATSVNQSYVVVGSISHQYGFSKTEQQPTQQEHQWVFWGKCFHNTSFPMVVMFRGRHIHLISAPVITFYGGFSKAEFSSLSLEPKQN